MIQTGIPENTENSSRDSVAVTIDNDRAPCLRITTTREWSNTETQKFNWQGSYQQNVRKRWRVERTIAKEPGQVPSPTCTCMACREAQCKDALNSIRKSFAYDRPVPRPYLGTEAGPLLGRRRMINSGSRPMAVRDLDSWRWSLLLLLLSSGQVLCSTAEY